MNTNKISEYQRMGLQMAVGIAEQYKGQGIDVVLEKLYDELAYRGYTQLPIFTDKKAKTVIKYSVDMVMENVREVDLTIIQYILVTRFGFSGSRIKEVDRCIKETCDKIVNRETGWKELIDDIEKETGIRINSMADNKADNK